MMNEKEKIRKGKFLSLILRHQPETIGLSLDEAGWASVDELLSQLAAHKKPLTRAELDEIVLTNDKQRYSFSVDGKQIRANQGHSLKTIELGLEPMQPPEVLYHGTASRFVHSILKQGLKAQSRQHVHLSKDTETATKVGMRHGMPIILLVDAQQMQADGYLFYCSANHVWLTEKVPAKYLKIV
ncbi:RNA 2'-phosphotransferase [uncultured Thiothrix sp.]|uniref:RNA 2'-phosphotransferase n=1 Tax=uncultured Thiothrix sp. TaxID=223185 RepID=UPI0026202D1D|nr:RNA 2'-phosphotransferase [uncultured Thiothrix sp.]